jgi:hypothetical protein
MERTCLLAYVQIRFSLLCSHMLQETVRMIYFSYFHSVMTYGIIYWGNYPRSIHIFRLQKMVIRIITNSRSRISYRELFKNLKILSLQSQHIFSLLLLFVVKNRTILRFIALIPDTVTIFIIQYVI